MYLCQGSDMDVGGYSRFKYLYFRSEYKASVSEPVRVRHRDWTEMVLGAHRSLCIPQIWVRSESHLYR